MKTALILEDNPSATKLLKEVLSESFSNIAITTASSLKRCREILETLEPDIALIDIGLPDGSGLEIIKNLKKHNTNTYIVVTTIFEDSNTLLSALHAGIDGYILKYQTKEMIVDLLKGITEGRPPLSPTVAKQLLEYFRPSPKEDINNRLSKREQEVLQLIAKGFSVVKTSELLGISKNTSAFHIKAIYKKLNVNSRAEATVEAARLGIISIPPE